MKLLEADTGSLSVIGLSRRAMALKNTEHPFSRLFREIQKESGVDMIFLG